MTHLPTAWVSSRATRSILSSPEASPRLFVATAIALRQFFFFPSFYPLSGIHHKQFQTLFLTRSPWKTFSKTDLTICPVFSYILSLSRQMLSWEMGPPPPEICTGGGVPYFFRDLHFICTDIYTLSAFVENEHVPEAFLVSEQTLMVHPLTGCCFIKASCGRWEAGELSNAITAGLGSWPPHSSIPQRRKTCIHSLEKFSGKQFSHNFSCEVELY